MPESQVKQLDEWVIRDILVCDPITTKGKIALAHLGLQDVVNEDYFFGINDPNECIYVPSKFCEEKSNFHAKPQENSLFSHYRISDKEHMEKSNNYKTFISKFNSNALAESPLLILGTSGNGKSILVYNLIRHPKTVINNYESVVFGGQYIYYDLDCSPTEFQLVDVFHAPDKNDPLWLICITLLNKFSELITLHEADIPTIVKNHDSIFREKYCDDNEKNLFNFISQFVSDNRASGKDLFKIIIEQIKKKNVHDALERILNMTMKFIHCIDPDKKNYLVFDNIEHFIEITDAKVYIPNKALDALYKCINNVTANLEELFNAIKEKNDESWRAFKIILVYRRSTLKIITPAAHYATMPHENEHDYSGHIDIWKIWENKKRLIWEAYLQSDYDPNQSSEIINILDDIMHDNDTTSVGTSYQELISPLLNGGIRRNAHSQAHAVMEVWDYVCCKKCNSYIDYNMFKELLKKARTNRYMYRHALLEIQYKWMITSPTAKKRFENLMLGSLSDERGAGKKDDYGQDIICRDVKYQARLATYARRILAYLSYYPDSEYNGVRSKKDLNMFDYKPLFELMRRLFLNPKDNDLLGNGHLTRTPTSADFYQPLAKILCSLGNIDYWDTRGGPMIVLNVDDPRMNPQDPEEGFAEILESIWNASTDRESGNSKYDAYDYSVRLTEAGRVFLEDAQPSFSFFAALYCCEEVPLFFLKDVERIKFVIKRVFDSAQNLCRSYEMVANSFCGVNTTILNERYQYVPMHNNKLVTFKTRVMDRHIEHLNLYKDYINTNAETLGLANPAILSWYIQMYIDKYLGWREGSKKCF